MRATVRQAARHLPAAFQEMIEDSEVAGIPVNDAAMPDRVAFYPSDRPSARRHPAVLLGDAIIPVRLQVGAGLNQGLLQAQDLAGALASSTPCASLAEWQDVALARLEPIVELGRSRAHRINLGWYLPVRPGRTTAPATDQWDEPKWVTA
jgi:2-polyprenyl-6-methoxyphenol hydroxylase-like FAD-dependent oxidoreductase